MQWECTIYMAMGKKHGKRSGSPKIVSTTYPSLQTRDANNSLAGHITSAVTPQVFTAIQPQAYPLTMLEASGISAVRRCVTLIANAIAGREWQEWQGTRRLPPSRIVRRPASLMTRREWVWRVIASMALEDICYLHMVGGVDDEGVPGSLIPLPKVAVAPTGKVDPFGIFPPTAYIIGGKQVSLESVIPIRSVFWPGIPPHLIGILQMARQVLMSSWSAGNYASRFWQQGGPPTTVIKTEQELNDTQASELSERWRNRRLQGPDYPAVLGRGADAKAFGADLTAGSAIEARREQDIEIARLFGVPVTYLGITLSGTSLEYSTLGDQVLSLDRFTLAGFYDPIQDTITDLLPSSDSEVENRRMVINMGPITQGNQESRYRAWSAALGQKPWMTPEEVREEEGRPPIELPEPEPEPVSAVAENEREGVPVA